MSQVKFKTEYNNSPVEVMGGYDRPLDCYHLTIFNLNDEDEETVWSNLDDNNLAFCKDIELLKTKLGEFNIEVPAGFWENSAKQEGNVTYLWNKHDNCWDRHNI